MIRMGMVNPHDFPWPIRKLVGHLKETLLIELVLNAGTFRIQVSASAKRVHEPFIAIETPNHQPTTFVWIRLFHVVVDLAHDG